MEGQRTVAGIILAAGESRRFGSPKQLAVLDGRTLLEHVLERAHEAGLHPLVAVVPPWLSRPASLGDSVALRWVRNPHPARGMSHSLRLGFAALPDEVMAAVILLGDQPNVPADHLRRLIAACGERPVVVTRPAGAGGQASPPILLERSHFSIVERPGGDIGLRDVLAAHPEWVMGLEVGERLPDVDTPTDLERLRGE